VTIYSSSRLGFSLIEVMIAIMILAIGILGAVSSMVSAVDVDSVTTEKDRALQAMESKLEDILTSSFNNAADFAGFYPVTGLSPPDGRTDVLEVTVTPLTGFENEYLIIELDTQWSGQVATETMSLTYGLSNRGG